MRLERPGLRSPGSRCRFRQSCEFLLHFFCWTVRCLSLLLDDVVCAAVEDKCPPTALKRHEVLPVGEAEHKGYFIRTPAYEEPLCEFFVPGGKVVKYAALGWSPGGFDALKSQIGFELIAL